MKNIFKIPLLVLVILMTGCTDDFLETTPQDQVPTEDVFTTIAGTEAALNGIYSAMQNYRYYGRNFFLNFDAGTDDVKMNPDNSGRFLTQNSMTKTAELGDGGSQYLRSYYVIRLSNNLINNIDVLEEGTEEQRNDLLGQALALRANTYFDLVRSFAFTYDFSDAGVAPGANGQGGHLGVPITLEASTESLPRNTVAEVYTQILSDLTTAKTLISDEARTNRMNLGAVNALLSEVYLYMNDYSNAYEYATEVINSGYSLTSSDAYTNAWSTGNNPDAIFSIVQTATDNQETNSFPYLYVAEGYGDLLPTDDIISIYSDSDIRKEWFKEVDGVVYNYKFPDKLASVPVIRVADVYLIAAEAAARGAASTSDARDFLFAVQNRADASTTPSNNSGNALLNEILLERRKELAFEGNRMFDLARFEKGFVRNDNGMFPTLEINYPNCQMILPIPNEEVTRNPLMVQTSCY